MTAGYDRRSRYARPISYSLKNSSNTATQYAGVFKQSSEQVISYRDDVKGTPLKPSDVDLYNGFFTRSHDIADYLNPGPQLLKNLEAAGLAVKSDYKSLDGEGLDNGHPFTSTKSSVSTSLQGLGNFYKPQGLTVRRRGGPIYHSRVIVNSTASSRMPFSFDPAGGNSRTFVPRYGLPVTGTDDLASYGTRAITLCAPSVPHVSMTAALGELALGLPALPGISLIKSGAFGSAGSEYLNIVFGILPTISDAQKIGKVLRDLTISLHQYRRDAGKRVRRNFVFPTMTSSEIFTSSDIESSNVVCANGGVLGFQQNTSSGTTSSGTAGRVGFEHSAYTELFMTSSREIWFSGSFTYFIPEIPGFSGRTERYMSELDRLLGLQLDSKVAWQLTPWSWLIDWFLDIRENIAAIQVAHDDNLVTNYAYAMERSVKTAVAKTMFPSSNVDLLPLGGGFVSTQISTISKRRLRANPYGFVSSADNGVWTPYRMAVLAALGISRT